MKSDWLLVLLVVFMGLAALGFLMSAVAKFMLLMH